MVYDSDYRLLWYSVVNENFLQLIELQETGEAFRDITSVTAIYCNRKAT